MSEVALGSGLTYGAGVEDDVARDCIRTAIEHGVTGVPTVLLDQVLPVHGAQDFSSYEHWIQRLLDRRSQED